MLKNIYKYPELERVDLDSGRHYLDSTGAPVPSVTTVLSNTSTKSGYLYIFLSIYIILYEIQ